MAQLAYGARRCGVAVEVRHLSQVVRQAVDNA